MSPYPRGRLAPSPTGEMHLGNASSALLAWLSVRARRGTIVMRMEDLDEGRVRKGLAAGILRDLEWLGLDWDGEIQVQSDRRELYDEAFRRLSAASRVYPCFCSRKDIAAAASAPQVPGDETPYPGTCREVPADTAAGLVAARERHAWRFRVEPGEATAFDDLVRGRWSGPVPGDFVVRRFDGTPAYQLAVVVDDAAMGIDEVVRGDDLLPSVARQLLLYEALNLSPPQFGHVPLLLDPAGVRLSKRQQGITLRELRDAGFSAPEIVGRLARLLGLRESPVPVPAAELVDGFSLGGLPPAPDGIIVDVSGWGAPRSR